MRTSFDIDNGQERLLPTSRVEKTPTVDETTRRATILVTSLFQFTSSLCVRLLYNLSSHQILLWGATLMSVLVPTYLYFRGKFSHYLEVVRNPEIRRLLMIYVVVDVIGAATAAYGFSRLPLSESVAIFFTNTTFSGINGAWILGERFTPLEILYSTISLCGVILVSRPPLLFGGGDQPTEEGQLSAGAHFFAAMIMMLCSFSFSLCYVIIRKMPRNIDTVTYLGYSNIGMALFSFIAGSIQNVFVPVTIGQAFKLIMNGLATFAFLRLLNNCFHLEKPSRVQIINLGMQLVYSSVVDLLFFGLIPPFISMIGIAMIVYSSYVILKGKS